MYLRPHHGLCLLNFVGEGYNGEFTNNMSRTAALLKAYPETQIEIAEGADDLCKNCPHRRGSRCESDHPLLFDQLVLKEIKLSPGEKLTWKEFSDRTRELAFNRLEEFCPGCQWLELCKKVSAAHREKRL